MMTRPDSAATRLDRCRMIGVLRTVWKTKADIDGMENRDGANKVENEGESG